MRTDRRWTRSVMTVGVLVTVSSAGCQTTDPTIQPSPDTSSVSEFVGPMSDEARYLATIAVMVDGTEYEGLPEADPQGFLASADLVCQLLDDGSSPDEVLARYLEELAEARGAESEDDAVLAGSLVGASVETFCPEYADELGSR